MQHKPSNNKKYNSSENHTQFAEKNVCLSEKRVKGDKMYSKFYNRVFSFCCSVACKYFKADCNVSKEFEAQVKSDKPMLILCNHLSSIDFLFASKPLWGKKVSFVVADNMHYSNKFLLGALKKYHSIFKKQFSLDILCIKKIKNYIDNGVSVVICPEGKVSAEGVTAEIQPSIGKLVKFLNCAVGKIVVSGAGLTRPKWAYSTRVGKIEGNANMLFSKQDVENLSVDEIYHKIANELAHNEHIYQEEKQILFKGKNFARGLERLLYKCPVCGEEFCNQTENDVIRCTKCGNMIRYEHNGKLVGINGGNAPFSRIDEWAEWQKEQELQEEIKTKVPITYPVWLFVGNREKVAYDFIAEGRLTYLDGVFQFVCDKPYIDKDVELDFNVSYMTPHIKTNGLKKYIDKKYQNLLFDMRNVPTVANIPGDTLDLMYENDACRFMFYEQRASTKLAYRVENYYKTKG